MARAGDESFQEHHATTEGALGLLEYISVITSERDARLLTVISQRIERHATYRLSSLTAEASDDQGVTHSVQDRLVAGCMASLRGLVLDRLCREKEKESGGVCHIECVRACARACMSVHECACA